MWGWLSEFLHFKVKLTFRLLKRFLGFNDFMIDAEIWNEVVLRVLSWCCFNLEFVVVLLLSLSKVKISHSDIMIFTEVWDKIVSWWRSWLSERGLESSTNSLLSISDDFLSFNDFFISSEIRNKIVNRPCWILPSWSVVSLIPWSLLRSWSIRDFDGLSIFWEECKGNTHLNRFEHFLYL
jgi:hypothetical protein